MSSSGTLTEDSLSLQNVPNVHSHHSDYVNYGYNATDRGVININPQLISHHYIPLSSPLEQLGKHSSLTASFDSAACSDPPRCADSTRLRILQVMEDWIHNETDTTIQSSLFWLHGGAGAGKSALAKSLSEKFQEKGQLAASFFFLRSDTTRNKGDQLIPTIVLHLMNSFEGISPLIEERIDRHRTLFTKTYQIQIRELIIVPLLLALNKALVSGPRLIVIDGLDQCEDPNTQCELLQAISRALRDIPYPFRFLVTSRPEAHITHLFSHDPDLRAITADRYNLSDDPDAHLDIRHFIEKEFVDIRRMHRLGPHLPDGWPDPKFITSLVERSSGHFIYASTVIRYIKCPKHHPDERLEVILRLRPPRKGDKPYAQLDELYDLIFDSIEAWELQKICLVLGILYLQSKRVGFFATYTIYTSMEALLKIQEGGLVLLLDPILSLVTISGRDIRILHNSLIDYLLDSSRGGRLPFDLARVHELAANYLLKERIMRNVCDLYEFQLFAYHCRYAHPNATLKDYLRSLEAPLPKSVGTVSMSFPSFHNVSTMEYIFWTLSREHLDITGELHEQYVTKWLDYLQSTFPNSAAQPKSRAALEKADDLKHDLDTLLALWKPESFNPVWSEKVPDRYAAFFKQEHRVFSAYAEASSSYLDNVDYATASSIVSGKYFIHSYYFGIRSDTYGFLTLRTYSLYGNRRYQAVRLAFLDVVQEADDYLKRAEMHLLSDLYQKYGIELEETCNI